MWKYLIILAILLYLINLHTNVNRPLLVVKKSPIHGVGLFANKNFRKGNFICTVAINNNIIRWAKYINHNKNRNIDLVQRGDVWIAIAEKNIIEGEEIVGDYDKTPYFIDKAKPNYV